MKAEVVPVGASKYRAWCDACQDGVNKNTRYSAERWADAHNARSHKELAA